MEIETYNVYISNDCVARDMSLDTAIILVRGLFHNYYNEPMPSVRIERQWREPAKEEIKAWE